MPFLTNFPKSMKKYESMPSGNPEIAVKKFPIKIL